MFPTTYRMLFVSLLTGVFAGPVLSQGLGAYIPGPSPQPGFFPQVPIVGTFSPQVPPAAILPRNVIGFRAANFGGFGHGGFGGYGYGYGGGFGYGGGYYGAPFWGYGNNWGYDPNLSVFQDPGPTRSVPLIGAGGPTGKLTVPISNMQPAELKVRLPVAGQLWVNGIPHDQSQSLFQVKSDPIRRGTQTRFEIRARWVVDGKAFEAVRSVDVRSGDTTKLTIVSGDPVSTGDRSAQSRP